MPPPPWFEPEPDLILTNQEVPRQCDAEISKKISKVCESSYLSRIDTAADRSSQPKPLRRSDRIRKRTPKKPLASSWYPATARPMTADLCHLKWMNHLHLLSSMEEMTTDEFRLPALSLTDLLFDDSWYSIKEALEDPQVEQVKVVEDESKGPDVGHSRVVEGASEVKWVEDARAKMSVAFVLNEEHV
ncbi:MAG: hypothetical protein Q9212_001957 [Teloschistes hypoglaucus]